MEELQPAEIIPSLEELDVSNNPLSSLDVSAMPALRRLNMDQSWISTLQGINSLKGLTHLSFRSQNTQKTPSTKVFSELHHLCLSSNRIPIFKTPVPFLSLQTLELATCGIQALSSDFGVKCPNIRSLNLNFNALRDIQSLAGIAKLDRLYLAGNRISKLRQTAGALEHLSASLLHLDLRDNPLTVGFYMPMNSTNHNDEKGLVPHSTDISLSEEREIESKWQMQYLLPNQLSGDHAAAPKPLDEATRVRRRVYEMLMTRTCGSLKSLDGLVVDRVGIEEKDGVWRRLKELGVLRDV